MARPDYIAEADNGERHDVVAWLADPGGIALHGRPGAVILVNGRAVDSRQYEAELGKPLTFKRASAK